MHAEPPEDDARVRDFTEADREDVLRCVRELQEAERALDPRLPPGASIAAAYLAEAEASCARWAGRLLVAEVDGRLAGFASIYAQVPFDSADDPAGTHALLGDLVVLAHARGRGVARALLRSAEAIARDAGAPELRVNALAANARANATYAAAGFSPYVVAHRKLLRPERDAGDGRAGATGTRAEPVSAADLVGGWRLERWSYVYEDGRPDEHPLGADAAGLILYTPDGHVSATLMRRAPDGATAHERPPPAGPHALAYAGRYRVEDGCVFHAIEICTDPALVGRTTMRRIDLAGERLLLSGHDFTAGSGRTQRIEWRRAHA